jgi:DNA polymerase-3 subunit delta'
VGHEKAVGLLEGGIKSGKLSHAYLFTGPRHVGKMTLALNLAQALNCLGEEKPCGQCRQCLRIAAIKHSNVQVVGLNGRSEIGIDQIREVQHLSSLKPGEGRHWVFIIDGAEHLSREASNCLLKTLEEPPPDVQLVLLAINARLLLPTVLSRCQRLELRPLAIAVVEQALRHRWGVPREQAGILARLSRGCLGWAVAASSDEEFIRERCQRLSILRHLAHVGRDERFAYAAELASQFGRDRASVQEVLQLWLGWWRDLMLVQGGCGNFATNVDQEAALDGEAQGYSLTQIRDFIQSMKQAMGQLDENANPRLVLEVLMLSIPRGKEDRG